MTRRTVVVDDDEPSLTRGAADDHDHHGDGEHIGDACSGSAECVVCDARSQSSRCEQEFGVEALPSAPGADGH
jgi:hypothetical protein